MKFKKTLLLLFFTSVCYAGDFIETIGPFGTLDDTHAAVTLPNSTSQDLLNVDISPQGKSVKKRKGYGTAFTLSNSTSPVHGTYLFYDSNGSDVALSFNGPNMNVSVSGGSPSVFFSTGPSGATYQCVDASAFAYCANTSRTSIVKVNSSTYTLITTVNSTGTILAVTPERLVMAGFSDAPSRIDFSKPNDFTTWTVGATNATGLQITITAPGSKITHLAYAHGRVYWFKDSSFGYIIVGPTDANAVAGTGWQVVTLNNAIGTFYNTSIFRDDILYFQGNDGHFYAWDGTSLTKLSTNIQTTISGTQGRIANSWTQTSASDWNSGNFDSSLFVDTDTLSGSIKTLFPDTFSTFNDGLKGTRGVYERQTGGITQATASVSSNQLVFMTTSTCTGPCYACFRTQSAFPTYTSGTTYYFEIQNIGHDTTGNNSFYFALKQGSKFTGATPAEGTYWYLQFNSTSNGGGSDFVKFVRMATDATNPLDKLVYNSVFSIPIRVSFYIDSSKFQYTVNGSSLIVQSTHNWTSPGIIYPALFLSRTTGSPQQSTVTLSNFDIVPQTFTFLSAVKNAPSLTTNDAFSATYIVTGGSQTFSHRARSGTFTVTASSPAFVSVFNGGIPTSTGTNFQISDYFQTISTGNSIRLDAFTQNWFEGAATDKTYALYHDNSNWWAVASGTGATNNNKILKYDLLNQGWLIYDIPMNGMYEKNQSLYFGAVDVGKIYKFGDIDNDNGSAINAYWKSKDFFGTNPFLDKDYKTLSVFSGSVINSTMTITWTVNGSSQTVYNIPLYNSKRSFVNHNSNLPIRVGNTINVKFGNNAVDQSFEVYGAQIQTNEKAWNVSP